MKMRQLSTLCAVAWLGACTGVRQRETEGQTLQRYTDFAGPPISSISYLGRFDSWRALGRDKLVVWTGVNDAYLLTVDPICHDLQFAERISLTSTAGNVSSGFDYVRLGRHERCRIIEIRPVDYRKLKETERAGG